MQKLTKQLKGAALELAETHIADAVREASIIQLAEQAAKDQQPATGDVVGRLVDLCTHNAGKPHMGNVKATASDPLKVVALALAEVYGSRTVAQALKVQLYEAVGKVNYPFRKMRGYPDSASTARAWADQYESAELAMQKVETIYKAIVAVQGNEILEEDKDIPF